MPLAQAAHRHIGHMAQTVAPVRKWTGPCFVEHGLALHPRSRGRGACQAGGCPGRVPENALCALLGGGAQQPTFI